MKNIVLICIILLNICCTASAGIISGAASGFIEKNGAIVVGCGPSIVMFETPFSVLNLFCKYGLFDNVNVFGRISSGIIDYSTVSSYEMTSSPSLYSIGIEYDFFKSADLAKRSILVVEYESAVWGVNTLTNNSNCTTIGVEFFDRPGDRRKHKTRYAAYMFDAGEDPGPKMVSGTKYGITFEDEYAFTGLVAGYIEGGILLGDQKGVLVFFGTGLNFTI